MIKALYVHIPFCRKFCPYCDYPKTLYSASTIEQYIESLLLDIKNLNIAKHSLKTIYFGGGTPNCLPFESMKTLLTNLAPLIDKKSKYEWTIEMNPELISRDILELVRSYGVNRISLGVQTFNDYQLELLGRLVNRETILNQLRLVGEYFDNYSVDLIYGLPEDDLDVLKENLRLLHEFNVPHISVYPLTVHRNTEYYRSGIKEQDEDKYVEFTYMINTVLKSYGYSHYEIVNYARTPENESMHNKVYWTASEYFGAGAGAHAYVDKKRYSKDRNVVAYISDSLKQENKVSVSFEEQKEEFISLGLRLKSGISFAMYKKRFGARFPEVVLDRIHSSSLKKHFLLSKRRLAVKEKSFVILDYLIRKILF